MTQNGRVAVKTIKALFERGVPVDLYLPDGWSGGRPGENQFNLKAVTPQPGKLIVNLGGGWRLTAHGEAVSVRPIVTKVRDELRGNPAVEISGFKELIYRNPSRERRYDEGVAMFVGGGYGSFQVETIMTFFDQGAPVDVYLPGADREAGGRPIDKRFQLKSVSQRSADITVELDGGYSLTFRGEAGDAPTVGQSGRKVIFISEFEKLTYRYPEGTTTYDGGIVTFVAGEVKQLEGTPS